MNAGLYLHVPFCTSRCDYCAFATWTDRHDLRSAYVDACITHLRREQQKDRNGGAFATFATVYLGGGTPSQLDENDLVRLVAAIDRHPLAEVTIEANPEDVTSAWARAAALAGATRISLGVQSLDPEVLKGLGRSHDPDSVATAARAIGEAGISSYSVDLIYGGAGETDSSWAATLDGVLSLDPAPSHVSAYALTVEPGTPLWRDASRHPDDDAQARRYEIADARLAAAGMAWYEISNWAAAGHESRHNMNYWQGGDYLAIGAAAHGHHSGHRWWNLRTPERYIAAVRENRSTVAAEEILSPAERALEAAELAIRTRDGIDGRWLPYPGDEALEGLVEPTGGGRLALTLRGRMLANEVALRLTPPPESVPEPDHVKGKETVLY